MRLVVVADTMAMTSRSTRWVLSPSRVGFPAYDDDSTSPPHVSEAGRPSARYAILDLTANAPVFELLSIPYAHDIVIRRAETAGRAGCAHALRTGFVDETAA